MSSLKQILFAEYDGFSDKRIKKLESGSVFIACDRSRGDYGADHQLFLWSCSIFVKVISDSEVSVHLSGGVPVNSEIKSWIRSNNYEFTETPQCALKMSLTPRTEQKLRDLAALTAAIVSLGKRYSTPAYKFVCPRSARSLNRLADALSSKWDA